MTQEMVAILGVGIALAGMILHTNREIIRVIGGFRSEIGGVRGELAGVRRDIAALRERMARLEGLFEGFTQRKPPEAE